MRGSSPPTAQIKSEAERRRHGYANLFVALPILLWAYLFIDAVRHYRHVATFGYSGEWDIWVYLPAGIAIGLILCAVFLTFVVRSGVVIFCLAMAALLGVLPYLIMTRGGV